MASNDKSPVPKAVAQEVPEQVQEVKEVVPEGYELVGRTMTGGMVLRSKRK